MNKYDYKIIGGGIAGLSFGVEAQRKGFNTILIDKDNLPKRKICGGLLTQKSMKLLDYLGLDRIKYITYMKDQADIYIDEKIELRDFFIPYVLFCDRLKLSQVMVDKYIELGGIIQKCYADDSSWIEAKETIYANGVDFDDIKKHKSHYALACEYDKCNDNLVIQFRPDIKGYRWQFPNNTGIGGRADKYDWFKENLVNKGAYLPYGYPILDKNKIGDRAGLCSPITGEGIYYALKSGIDRANNKGHFKIWFRLKFEKLLADMFWNISFVKNCFKNKDFSYFVLSKLLN